MTRIDQRYFIGRGSRTDLEERIEEIQPWEGRIGEWCTEQLSEQQIRTEQLDHPEDYEADLGLADAVNVALALGRPLLLTGRPGTGKSQLADRVAWEFNLAPVLRFEAQSVSEAQDLFYRFDTVGRLAAAHAPGPAGVDPKEYMRFVALGKAVLFSKPRYEAEDLFRSPALKLQHPAPETGRPSVVLIDEIDKASRDFPNDLLAAVEHLRFRVNEIGREFQASPAPSMRPITIITSNSERELPEPFLRRCVYYNIEDPGEETLARIVQRRVLQHVPTMRGNGGSLFDDLVRCFIDYRNEMPNGATYKPGTSELIDLARVVAGNLDGADSSSRDRAMLGEIMRRASSAVAKARDDRTAFEQHVRAWQSGTDGHS
jgi:MoxR-like ATPase